MVAAAYNLSNGTPNPYEIPSMLGPVELSRIIISEINEQQMIWLKEVDGAALAVVETADQVAAILHYVRDGVL